MQGKIKKQSINPWPNGILALKGGDLSEELAEVDYPTERLPISEWLINRFSRPSRWSTSSSNAAFAGLKRKKGNPIGPPFNNLQEIETNTVFSDRVCT